MRKEAVPTLNPWGPRGHERVPGTPRDAPLAWAPSLVPCWHAQQQTRSLPQSSPAGKQAPFVRDTLARGIDFEQAFLALYFGMLIHTHTPKQQRSKEWRLLGMLRRVAVVTTEVSEELSASIIRLESVNCEQR
jgi:hypothetical protein